MNERNFRSEGIIYMQFLSKRKKLALDRVSILFKFIPDRKSAFPREYLLLHI